MFFLLEQFCILCPFVVELFGFFARTDEKLHGGGGRVKIVVHKGYSTCSYVFLPKIDNLISSARDICLFMLKQFPSFLVSL